MKKVIFLAFLVLLSSIGGLLFWQWHAYSEQQLPDSSVMESALQEISVQSGAKELKVTQRVYGLTEEETYTLQVPEQLFKWTCMTKDGNICEPVGDNPREVIAYNGEFLFEYIIPLSNTDTALLLKNWYTIIADVNITETNIEITDAARRVGFWVSGLPLKGAVEKELIDYYNYAGSGTAGELYWQPAGLKVAGSNSQLTYYTAENYSSITGMKSSFLGKLNDFPHMAIVLTDSHKPYTGSRLLIANPGSGQKELEKILVQRYFQSKFSDIQLEENWLPDLFTAVTFGTKPATAKGAAVLKELQGQMADEELHWFVQSILQETANPTLAVLDQALSNIFGLKTKFFTLNATNTAEVLKLYFYDERPIRLNGAIADLNIIYDGTKRLYPFSGIMEGLGYNINKLNDEQAVLLQKGDEHYRFYFNRNLFIHNDENYGLLQNPLTMLGGNVYMEKQWLEAIFKLTIEEAEMEIVIEG